MKKTFLVRRNALLSVRPISWGAFALVFVCLVLLVRVFAPNFFWYVFAPVFQTTNGFAEETHLLLSGFTNATVNAKRNEELQEKNETLANENKMLTQKVADLSALLGESGGSSARSGILADVVSRPPESPYDTLVLASGSSEGISSGMEVFGSSGTPLGVVSSVLAHFSQVTLFSAPGMTTNGWVGHANTPLVIVGVGAGALQASISRSANVAVDDIVSVPGPGSVPLGRVARIDSDPSSPGVTLHIVSLSNLFSTTRVLVRATGFVPSAFATSTMP